MCSIGEHCCFKLKGNPEKFEETVSTSAELTPPLTNGWNLIWYRIRCVCHVNCWSVVFDNALFISFKCCWHCSWMWNWIKPALFQKTVFKHLQFKTSIWLLALENGCNVSRCEIIFLLVMLTDNMEWSLACCTSKSWTYN